MIINIIQNISIYEFQVFDVVKTLAKISRELQRLGTYPQRDSRTLNKNGLVEIAVC